MTPEEKRAHAEEAFAMLDHPLVQSVVSEFAQNMGFSLATDNLPRYGITKVINYVAQVVLAKTKGIDPDELRISQEDLNEIASEMIAPEDEHAQEDDCEHNPQCLSDKLFESDSKNWKIRHGDD